MTPRVFLPHGGTLTCQHSKNMFSIPMHNQVMTTCPFSKTERRLPLPCPWMSEPADAWAHRSHGAVPFSPHVTQTDVCFHLHAYDFDHRKWCLCISSYARTCFFTPPGMSFLANKLAQVNSNPKLIQNNSKQDRIVSLLSPAWHRKLLVPHKPTNLISLCLHSSPMDRVKWGILWESPAPILISHPILMTVSSCMHLSLHVILLFSFSAWIALSLLWHQTKRWMKE